MYFMEVLYMWIRYDYVYREHIMQRYQILLSDCCCVYVAVRMVDAVSLSRLPYAFGSLHQSWGCPSAHALPRPPRTDEVRK